MADPARRLTDEDRRALLEKGYRPVEIWVPNLDDPKVIAALREEARRIGEADRREPIDKDLEAYAGELIGREPDYEW